MDDTINTQLRIQGKYNGFNQELLISGNLKDQLDNTGFDFSKLESIDPKGKEKKVLIYALHDTKH